jgi:hypothetical protein
LRGIAERVIVALPEKQSYLPEKQLTCAAARSNAERRCG